MNLLSNFSRVIFVGIKTVISMLLIFVAMLFIAGLSEKMIEDSGIPMLFFLLGCLVTREVFQALDEMKKK